VKGLRPFTPRFAYNAGNLVDSSPPSPREGGILVTVQKLPQKSSGMFVEVFFLLAIEKQIKL